MWGCIIWKDYIMYICILKMQDWNNFLFTVAQNMVAKDWFLPQLLSSFDLLIQDWLGSSEGFLEVRQPMQDEGPKPLSAKSSWLIYLARVWMTLIISSHSSCSSCVGAGRVMYFPILHVQCLPICLYRVDFIGCMCTTVMHMHMFKSTLQPFHS